MSKKIKVLTPRIYEHSDFFHNAVDFAREHSLNTNELCLELSHYLVDNFDKVWKIEKPRVYKKLADLEAKLAEKDEEIKHRHWVIKSGLSVQDKISFAVEQLEELRLSFICNYHDNISWIDDRENSCCLSLTTTIYNTTMDIFDNQIKQLKEGK